MRRTRQAIITALLLTGVAAASAFVGVKIPLPQVIRVFGVTPPEGEPGDILTAYGDALGADHVVEVYLVNDLKNYKVEVLEQADEWFNFRIPAGIPAGMFRVAVVGRESPIILEEPAVVRVIETKGTLERRVMHSSGHTVPSDRLASTICFSPADRAKIAGKADHWPQRKQAEEIEPNSSFVNCSKLPRTPLCK